MRSFLIVFALSLFVMGEGLENLMGSEIQQCINCLCHARTGCWRRTNCASYSIPEEYWRIAGSPALAESRDSNAYSSCMKDENCILNTVKAYTETVGSRKDCNCDGRFDCKDRMAIHLFGEDCTNPKYGAIYSRRFNECNTAAGVSVMGPVEANCEPEVF